MGAALAQKQLHNKNNHEGISNYPECLIENFLKSSVRAIHDSIIWQLCPEYFDGKQDDDGLYIHIGVYVW